MAFPTFYPYRPKADLDSICYGGCGILSTKQNTSAFRFPSFFTKADGSSMKKIMLVLDVAATSQVNAFPLTPPEQLENLLWSNPTHRILQVVLSTLVDEQVPMFITHGLKCEQHSQFANAHRKYIFTSSKKVQEKEAAKSWYEQEKPHFGFCMQHVVKEIEAYDPDIIVTFGHRITTMLMPNAPQGIYTSRNGVYGERNGTAEIDLCGRKRTIVTTLGLREVSINNHLASQLKVDLGRALWLASGIPEGFDRIPPKQNLYQIRTAEDYQKLIDYLRASNVPFAWDTETSSLKKHENICFMMSLSFDGLTSYTIPIVASRFLYGHNDVEFESLSKELLSTINEKICHNTKFDIQAISTGGIYLGDGNWMPVNTCWDTTVLGYVFEENFSDGTWVEEKQPGLTRGGMGWQALAEHVQHILGIYDKQWMDEKEDRKDIAASILKHGWDKTAEYAGKDAIYTYRVWYAYLTLMRRAQAKELERVAKRMLGKHVYTLARVERAGLPIDMLGINNMMDPTKEGSLAQEVKAAKAEFLKLPSVQRFSSALAKSMPAAAPQRTQLFKAPTLQLAPVEPFNIGSSTQLAQFFFDHLGLKPLGEKRSTNKDFIAHYAPTVPEVRLLKIVRERGKVLGTFLPSFKDNASQYSDFRVRASYGIYTTTGRTSCKDPNLQQIPRSGEKSNEIKGSVKKVIVARPGYCLIAADYATAEIRMLAMVAKDHTLANVFKKVDTYREEFIKNPTPELYTKMKFEADFHRQNASNMLGVPIFEVTKEQRTAAKSLSFMIVYSCYPAPNLAGTLGISVPEAQKLIDAYLGVYPQVNAWFKEIEEEAKTTGYAWNIFGQRRALYGIWGNKHECSHILNVNRNARVQGPASHWTLLAAYDYQRMVRQAGHDIRIVNLVHDAIYVEMPIPLVKEWMPKLLRTMEKPPSALELLGEELFNFVPMSADCEIGLSLYSQATWDDTPEHLDMILDWMARGGAKSEIPDSPYDMEAKKKKDAALAAKQPIPEPEPEADPDFGAEEEEELETESEEV